MLILERTINGGVQKIYRFENGYGASVIKSEYSYGGSNGKWELAVIKYDGYGEYDWDIDYTTKITNDVIGHLSWEEAEKTLEDIKNLKGEQK